MATDGPPAQILGTIALLFTYLLATVGAVRYLFFSGESKAPMWQALVPTLGGAFVVYTIYKNVYNVPAPYSHFGWIVLALPGKVGCDAIGIVFRRFAAGPAQSAALLWESIALPPESAP